MPLDQPPPPYPPTHSPTQQDRIYGAKTALLGADHIITSVENAVLKTMLSTP